MLAAARNAGGHERTVTVSRMDKIERDYQRTLLWAKIVTTLYVVGGLLACGFGAWVVLAIMHHFGIIG